MADENPIQPANQIGTDVFGIGAWAKYLADPLMRGVGAILSPIQSRRENKAQIKNFSDWDDAFKARGYDGRSAELTISQRTEVRLLAEQTGYQRNREAVAAATVDQALLEDHNPALPPPEISPDWLDQFWQLAEKTSNQDMQAFWGTILARTCLGKTPPVSARTLAFIATLSAEEAKALEKAASYYIVIESDTGFYDHAILRSLSGHDQHLGEREQQLERLNTQLAHHIGDLKQILFGAVGVFVESGWAYPIVQRASGHEVHFVLGGQRMRGTSSQPLRTDHGLYYIGGHTQVTPLGQEIFQFLKPTPDEQYLALIKKGFELKGVQLEIEPQ